MYVPSRGDIVIAYFPQEDHKTYDFRPCFVLSVENDSILAIKITTTNLSQKWAYKLDKGAVLTSKGIIQKDSWINLRRRERIPIGDIKKIVATLKPNVLETICEQLTKLLKP
jgi:mRNA-degrading endonuclease toxin of MazEF toxin-antitoxin module